VIDLDAGSFVLNSLYQLIQRVSIVLWKFCWIWLWFEICELWILFCTIALWVLERYRILCH